MENCRSDVLSDQWFASFGLGDQMLVFTVNCFLSNIGVICTKLGGGKNFFTQTFFWEGGGDVKVGRIK